MIKIKTNLKQFIAVLNIIKNITIETTLEFNKDNISIRFASPSGTSLGLIKFNKSFFDEYSIEEEQNITVDSVLFHKIVKKVGKKDIDISILDRGCNIKVESGKTFFNLNTYTTPIDERPIPTPEFESVWNIESKSFADLITEHLEFSEVAKFVSDGEILKTTIKSNMISGVVVSTAECKLQKDISCYYDIKILSVILDIKNIFDKIEFSFGSEIPCKLSCTNDILNFDWYLAPRIGDDD